MTYKRLKLLIASGNYRKEDMLNKMDVFLMAGRITIDEYYDLKGMITADYPELNALPNE